MPRPKRKRIVMSLPSVNRFNPSGVGIPEEVQIYVEHYEALRLKDLEGLDQAEASNRMEISQPTFHRLLRDARKRIADAIVNGKSIKIEGGNYSLGKSSDKAITSQEA